MTTYKIPENIYQQYRRDCINGYSEGWDAWKYEHYPLMKLEKVKTNDKTQD